MGIFTDGGSVRVTIAANVGQGNGGTSLVCKGCFVSPDATNTGSIRMNIHAAASSVLGIVLPNSDEGTPIFVPIDDVSHLYFYGGTNGDKVDIMYLR